MIAVLFSILLGVIAYNFNQFIRKYFNIILGITIVTSIITFFIDLELFTQGFIGLAFFIVVMYAGALKKGSILNKRLRSVRKEYSILGFIVLLPHSIKYGLDFLTGSYPTEWIGVIAYVLMIPLFVTSFQKIKKRMDIKDWFKLQKWAYLIYLLIYIHLLLIGQADHIMAYTVIFSGYTFFKMKNYLFTKDSQSIMIIKTVVVTLVGLFSSLLFTDTIDISTVIADTSEDPGEVSSNLEDPATPDLEDTLNGVFTGYGTGFRGMDVEVNVTLTDGMIIEIDIIEYGATSPNHGTDFKAAADQMAQDIIDAQSTDIDTISGATYTTSGLQEAVDDALNN